MFQNAFWGFLAASQKNVQKVSGKCPGAGVAQEKCPERKLRKRRKEKKKKMSKREFPETCPKSVQYMSKTCRKLVDNLSKTCRTLVEKIFKNSKINKNHNITNDNNTDNPLDTSARSSRILFRCLTSNPARAAARGRPLGTGRRHGSVHPGPPRRSGHLHGHHQH